MVPINHCRRILVRYVCLGVAGAVGVLWVGGVQPLSLAIALCLLLAAAASSFVLARQWHDISISILQRVRARGEVDGLARWRARPKADRVAPIEAARERLESQVATLTMDFARLATAQALDSGPASAASPSVRAAMKLRSELMSEFSEFVEEIEKMVKESAPLVKWAQTIDATIEAERSGDPGQGRQFLAESEESTDITVF